MGPNASASPMDTRAGPPGNGPPLFFRNGFFPWLDRHPRLLRGKGSNIFGSDPPSRPTGRHQPKIHSKFPRQPPGGRSRGDRFAGCRWRCSSGRRFDAAFHGNRASATGGSGETSTPSMPRASFLFEGHEYVTHLDRLTGSYPDILHPFPIPERGFPRSRLVRLDDEHGLPVHNLVSHRHEHFDDLTFMDPSPRSGSLNSTAIPPPDPAAWCLSMAALYSTGLKQPARAAYLRSHIEWMLGNRVSPERPSKSFPGRAGIPFPSDREGSRYQSR